MLYASAAAADMPADPFNSFAVPSFTWFLNYFAAQGLAYRLVDEGFDVWCPNSRGTIYSTNTHLSPDDTKYWAFSFDQMAKVRCL